MYYTVYYTVDQQCSSNVLSLCKIITHRLQSLCQCHYTPHHRQCLAINVNDLINFCCAPCVTNYSSTAHYAQCTQHWH